MSRSARSSVPVQFQYFLPTYSSSPYHTYTPITSSVPTLRQYPGELEEKKAKIHEDDTELPFSFF